MKHIATWTRTGIFFACWIGIAGLAVGKSAPKNPSGFYVANWNVENLFDTRDDPRNRGDNEFLPNNPTTRWTRARFQTKLKNLAQVITGMNHSKGPDILGLQEVENEQVLKRLLKKMPGKSYGIVHEDSPDRRGIDTALLYNQKAFSLVTSRTYKVSLKWKRTTRDILHAVLKDRRGKQLHVLVNHWPSRGGGIKASEGNRFEAARTLAKAISRIFRGEPKARIIVLLAAALLAYVTVFFLGAGPRVIFGLFVSIRKFGRQA